jgi:hypothetical protein
LTQSVDRPVAVAERFGIPLLELGDVREERAHPALERMALARRCRPRPLGLRGEALVRLFELFDALLTLGGLGAER